MTGPPNLSQQIEACELAAYRVSQRKPLTMRDAERDDTRAGLRPRLRRCAE
jgi:hypothetical protein